MQSQAYEITFMGQAGTTLRAEFDDCEVTIGPDTTTLHAELPDQGALSGLVQRITGLGLEVIHMHLVAPPPTPLNTATSCGMAVIATIRDAGAPIRAPSRVLLGSTRTSAAARSVYLVEDFVTSL